VDARLVREGVAAALLRCTCIPVTFATRRLAGTSRLV
jgi:hypothetical protein